MPFERTRELVGFQRWVIGGYDRTIGWEEWTKAQYRPTRLRRLPDHQQALKLDGEPTAGGKRPG